MSLKRMYKLTKNYKDDKSTFANGGDSEKTQKLSKSAVTTLVKSKRNHSYSYK